MNAPYGGARIASPGAPDPCPACGAPRTEPGACDRCGAVYGAEHTCAHCGGVTRAVREGKRGWVCAACGGPRVRGIGRDPILDDALARVKKGWFAEGPLAVVRVIFGLMAVLGVLAGAELAATLGIGIFSGAFLLAWIGGWLVASLAIASKRARAMAEGKRALDEARSRAAALLVAKTPGGVTSAALAEALGVPEPEAERVLIELSATNNVRIDVEEDLRYRVSNPPVLEDAHDEAAALPDEHRRRRREPG